MLLAQNEFECLVSHRKGNQMLTKRQLECYNTIKDYKDRNGIAPSYEEISDMMGLNSKSRVYKLITALEERGAIHRFPNRARGLILRELQ